MSYAVPSKSVGRTLRVCAVPVPCPVPRRKFAERSCRTAPENRAAERGQGHGPCARERTHGSRTHRVALRQVPAIFGGLLPPTMALDMVKYVGDQENSAVSFQLLLGVALIACFLFIPMTVKLTHWYDKTTVCALAPPPPLPPGVTRPVVPRARASLVRPWPLGRGAPCPPVRPQRSSGRPQCRRIPHGVDGGPIGCEARWGSPGAEPGETEVLQGQRKGGAAWGTGRPALEEGSTQFHPIRFCPPTRPSNHFAIASTAIEPALQPPVTAVAAARKPPLLPCSHSSRNSKAGDQA